MILFKDFEARVTDAGFFSSEYESLDVVLRDVNQWIDDNTIDLVNIETVVLPNMMHSGQEGTVDVELHTSGKMGSTWHQFFRVWYRAT